MKVGFVGWRGMVGSVLMSRMIQENDFAQFEPVFFSTSNIGGTLPFNIKNKSGSNGNNSNSSNSNNNNVNNKSDINHNAPNNAPKLLDAYDINELIKLDCILTCQGSAYTLEMLPKLRNAGFDGYWIDASSSLRMQDDTIIILDPVNRSTIDAGLKNGIKQYSVGNCSVSCMLMGISGLFKHNLVEWISTMTYQAASGAGANNVRELLLQSGVMYNSVSDLLNSQDSNILDITQKASDILRSPELPAQYFGTALAGSLIPWIDVAMNNGQTKEEWKGMAETNKILGLITNSDNLNAPGALNAPNSHNNKYNQHTNLKKLIGVDGICTRVGSLRCHSQALTIKLTNQNVSIDSINEILANSNQWVKLIPNTKEDTLKYLTPTYINGTLDIAVGRVRKMNFDPSVLTLFTVGDQLLWGAAEPLRRMLNILVDFYKP